MDDAPPSRPAGVPEEATWLAQESLWEVAETDGGVRHGACVRWRRDGTLYARWTFAAGEPVGKFRVFHPNGEVAREGEYVGGRLHGVVNAYMSSAPTPERLRSCCVPPGAFRMEARYEDGRLQREIFLDREDRRLLSDGAIRPSRPAGVPDAAEYDEWQKRWLCGPVDPDSRYPTGTWKHWDGDGVLVEEIDHRAQGERAGSRRFARDGSVKEDTQLDAEQRRHGEYLRRFVDDDVSPYQDTRIAEVRGVHHHGEPIGSWRWLDASGAVLRALDLGAAFDEQVLAGEAFADERHDAARWRAMAERCREEGRAREAVVAAARAAAAAGDAASLRRFLEETAPALTAEARVAVDQILQEGKDESLAVVLTGLVTGGDPALHLRHLASLQKQAPRVALDLVDAAILLAPDWPMPYVTRALVRVELGDREGALADAARLPAQAEESIAFLRDYTRVIFTSFPFRPPDEIRDVAFPPEALAEMPEQPGQALAVIRRTIQVYATRLQMVRAVLLAQIAPPRDWFPPDLSALLPGGPIALEKRTASITDETESGPETVEVEIDETLVVAGGSVPALLRVARRDHFALSWLCWACGVRDGIGLPDEVRSPPRFPHAILLAMQRAFRAHDNLVTAGLRSMTQGVPGFVWEGMEIDGLPRVFSEIAADEYLEMRAVFLWLASPENLSPFQSDLRSL